MISKFNAVLGCHTKYQMTLIKQLKPFLTILEAKSLRSACCVFRGFSPCLYNVPTLCLHVTFSLWFSSCDFPNVFFISNMVY